MSSKEKGPPAVATQDDPGRTKLNADIPIKPNTETQGTIAALRRDFVAEALRVASVKASHAADDIEIGDDLCAERGISIVIAHVKEAASTFREMKRGKP